MSEDEDILDTLTEAREQLVQERRTLAKTVARNAEARAKFITLQNTIEAIDAAIEDEEEREQEDEDDDK